MKGLVASLILFGILVSGLNAEQGKVRTIAPADAGFGAYLRWTPASPSGRLDWLLVTPKRLVKAFSPLVKERRQLGLVAEVITTEDVAHDVMLGGGDFPERLRNLVRHSGFPPALHQPPRGSRDPSLARPSSTRGLQGREERWRLDHGHARDPACGAGFGFLH